jgi:hypothetical protein
MSDTAPMSDPDSHAVNGGGAPATVDHHAAGDHDPGGSGHGHGETSEPLGPPDLAAWAYALAGGAVGLVTALALYVASHP